MRRISWRIKYQFEERMQHGREGKYQLEESVVVDGEERIKLN